MKVEWNEGYEKGYADAMQEKEMNNEPIWTACLDCGKKVTGDSIHTCSPQLKTLTDEEIKELYGVYNYRYGFDEIEFARAILRKAQEK